jgi:hypothetical protein
MDPNEKTLGFKLILANTFLDKREFDNGETNEFGLL